MVGCGLETLRGKCHYNNILFCIVLYCVVLYCIDRLVGLGDLG